MDQALLSTDIVNEILQLHDERIKEYTNVLLDTPNLHANVKSVFERIIEEAVQCRDEMSKYGNQSISPRFAGKGESTLSGANNQKKILEDSVNELQLVLKIYQTALAMWEISADLKQILIKQQARLESLLNYVNGEWKSLKE